MRQENEPPQEYQHVPPEAPIFNWNRWDDSGHEVNEERLSELFNEIDTHRDGFITKEELTDYMQKRGDYEYDEQELNEIIERGDIKKDGKLDYQEFMLYMIEHERNLWSNFKQLDKDDNGHICYTDLTKYCQSQNLNIPEERMRQLIARLDKDNNLTIDWEEFREFNQFKLKYNISNYFDQSFLGCSYGDNINFPQDQRQKTGKTSHLKYIVCGGIAGVTSRTCTAPLDRLKVLLQVQGQQKVLGVESELGAMGIMRTMYRHGVTTMWSGNFINCCKIFPESALRLVLFEKLCHHFPESWVENDYINSTVLGRFVCGSITGLCVQSMMYPFEIVKTRLMISKKGTKILPICRELYFKKLFRGLSPALAGVIPFAGCELGLSRCLTDYYKKRCDIENPGWYPLFGIGAVSTTIAMTLTYPIRLITCQIQAHKGQESPKFFSIASRIHKADGVKGLYRGFLANGLKTIPSSAIVWTVYNSSQQYYDKYLGY